MSKSKLDFVLDVDGVLTDGTFLYDENGKVLKSFGPHDSFMLNKIKDRLNIHFISADHRGFKITTQRVEDMGFKVTLVNEKDRVEYIENNFLQNFYRTWVRCTLATLWALDKWVCGALKGQKHWTKNN